jgi:hypothetical protein
MPTWAIIAIIVLFFVITIILTGVFTFQHAKRKFTGTPIKEEDIPKDISFKVVDFCGMNPGHMVIFHPKGEKPYCRFIRPGRKSILNGNWYIKKEGRFFRHGYDELGKRRLEEVRDCYFQPLQI